jgi:hypothetical protein
MREPYRMDSELSLDARAAPRHRRLGATEAIVARARAIATALGGIRLGLLGCALVACSDGGGAAPASDASDPVQALLALAHDSDPDARNLAISLCVISAMEAQHGAAAANLVVAAAAAQARGERPSADTVPALTVMIPIALECTRSYELHTAAGRSASSAASLR